VTAIVINAAAQAVNEMMCRMVLAQAYREDHAHEVHEWHMHPAQYASMGHLIQAVALSVINTHAPKDFVREVKKQFEDYGPTTFLGRPIRKNPKIDPSIIELHTAHGELIAVITNLAIPAGFDVT
jgi:hypothetical protein